jgi:hypothetical protein
VRTSSPSTSAACPQELGENSAQRLDGSPERQLAHEQDPLQGVARSRAEGAENGRGDGEVEPAARLLDVGGGEVDDDAALVDVHPDLREGTLDPYAALPNCRLGEADEFEERRPSHGGNFDANGMGLKADERGTEGGGKHETSRL